MRAQIFRTRRLASHTLRDVTVTLCRNAATPTARVSLEYMTGRRTTRSDTQPISQERAPRSPDTRKMTVPWWRWPEDQWWLYWFFDSAWWLGASQGAVGALIGFIGLFVAFRISQRGDKKKRLEEQGLTGIANIMQMVSDLRNKQPHEIEEKELLALENELMLFYVHQVQGRRKTALWAISKAGILRLRHNNTDYGTAAAREYSINMGRELTEWLLGNSREGKLRPKQPTDSIAEWDAIIDRYENAPSILKPSEEGTDARIDDT